jgi:hypothetical protein
LPRGIGSARRGDENGKSRGYREPRGDDRSPNQYRKTLRFTAIIREQFRQFASALTRRAPEPEEEKRSGDARGGFRVAAAEFARRAVLIPEAAYAAIAFLSDTLDWLNPFHYGAACNDAFDEEIHPPEPGPFIHHL